MGLCVESFQILNYPAVLSFALRVGLRVVRRRRPMSNVELPADFGHIVILKFFSVIGDEHVHC